MAKFKIKIDPVENTEEYKAAMEHIGPALEREFKDRQGLGTVHVYWYRKKELLQRYGIEWRSPGENFNDAIDKALQKSELFTLLVTPNLINEENYVRSVEYPAAQNAGKEILPAEVEATDPKELRKQFEGIPECVNVKDENEFRERLLTTVSRLALRENDADPAHNFLIGLAYLDGIDVEVDRARAVELITGAAEAELPETMKKLQSMYHDGVGVERDYREALKWHSRAADFYLKEYGKGHPDTFTTL